MENSDTDTLRDALKRSSDEHSDSSREVSNNPSVNNVDLILHTSKQFKPTLSNTVAVSKIANWQPGNKISPPTNRKHIKKLATKSFKYFYHIFCEKCNDPNIEGNCSKCGVSIGTNK